MAGGLNRLLPPILPFVRYGSPPPRGRGIWNRSSLPLCLYPSTVNTRNSMFRHLGVSIDSSDPSTEATIQAIWLAHEMRARVSFWYAQPIPDNSLAEVHSEYKASEVLIRADAAARALGLSPYVAANLFADRAGHEILNAAALAGCDAIVLTHNPARELRGSTAYELLANATVPVLIEPACAPARIPAVELLRTEYQRLTSLLHRWLCLLSTVHAQDERALHPYWLAMQSVITYVRQTVHPLQRCKEARLFSRLQHRAPEVRAEVDELLLLNRREQELLDDLESNVARPLGSKAALAGLSSALTRYANLVWSTRGREESVILPAAIRHLKTTEWERLHAEFHDACWASDSANASATFASLSDTLYADMGPGCRDVSACPTAN